MTVPHAPVAQLDRVTVSEAVGRWFESNRARHSITVANFRDRRLRSRSSRRRGGKAPGWLSRRSRQRAGDACRVHVSARFGGLRVLSPGRRGGREVPTATVGVPTATGAGMGRRRGTTRGSPTEVQPLQSPSTNPGGVWSAPRRCTSASQQRRTGVTGGASARCTTRSSSPRPSARSSRRGISSSRGYSPCRHCPICRRSACVAATTTSARWPRR